MLGRIGQMLLQAIRRYFVAGLVALAPLVVTIAAIAWIIGTLDSLLLPRVIDWFVPGLETPPQAPPRTTGGGSLLLSCRKNGDASRP